MMKGPGFLYRQRSSSSNHILDDQEVEDLLNQVKSKDAPFRRSCIFEDRGPSDRTEEGEKVRTEDRGIAKRRRRKTFPDFLTGVRAQSVRVRLRECVRGGAIGHTWGGRNRARRQR